MTSLFPRLQAPGAVTLSNYEGTEGPTPSHASREGDAPFETPGRGFQFLSQEETDNCRCHPAAQERGLRRLAAGTSKLGLEREKGFEPSTLALARRCSTTELFPLEKCEERGRILLMG
jgi:hypothetical protein